MDAIADLVAQAHAAGSRLPEIRRLHDVMKQSEEMLNRNAERLDTFLVQLDPKSHTLAFLYLL